MTFPVELSGLGDAEKGLKDFQKATVDYVFRRLYEDEDYTRRFLIADEVGLGKTLVARGIIARAIRRLWDQADSINVVYICSNSNIARQNIDRLNVTGEQEFDLASRLTLLPVEVSDLRTRKLNFVGLTPQTSFNLRSSKGTKRERALLYHLLDRAWDLDGAPPLNVLQGDVQDWRRFRRYVRAFPKKFDIDSRLAKSFAERLAEQATKSRQGRPDSLEEEFQAVCERFPRARQDPYRTPDADRRAQREIIGKLRYQLAVTCVEALKPKLVILDEFQRFKDLLTGDDEASFLAQRLFEYSSQDAEVRVLLLSATPYKMYTLPGNPTDDDHYRDFLETLRFLQDDPEETRRTKDLLRAYRRQLYRLDEDSLSDVRRLKSKIEGVLRQVMVRTERLSSSTDRDGMLREVEGEGLRMEPSDVDTYLGLQRIARIFNHRDTLSYWKAAPYLLTFMDGYKLKIKFAEELASGELSDDLFDAVSRSEGLLLPGSKIRSYDEIEAANPRLRAVATDILESGVWRLLWIPPSFPYYEPSPPFSDEQLQSFTKRLVFSAWRVVPKALATLLSYGAERRIVRSWEPEARNTQKRRKNLHRPLQFARSEGRLTGMPVLGMLYPSTVLARTCDPLEIAQNLVDDATEVSPKSKAKVPSSAVLDEARSRIDLLLDPFLEQTPEEGAPDEAWYWAAPLLLDQAEDPNATVDWWNRSDLAEVWAGTQEGVESSRWADHVGAARESLDGKLELGPPPDDLASVLALIGTAGPSVVAIRALNRILPGSAYNSDVRLRDAAAQAGWAFRSLFNSPEAVALIRGLDEREPFWRRVLEYSMAGNLQAVMDEYVHVLKEALGHVGAADMEMVESISDKVQESLGLRTASLRTDEISLDEEAGSIQLHDDEHMRVHFAHRFGDESGTEEQAGHRAEQLRWAFNSPFWPFVLATTSVGQEGLDFHTYCHSVVHWNLPSNPVDLEQREGRVHRYKGHAVRRNLAQDFGDHVLKACTSGRDPWECLFHQGAEAREVDESELVPFWVYRGRDGKGSARIERHVPSLPLSRDTLRLSALKRSLAVYRMVFGQPRQEDLLEFLFDQFGQPQVEEWLDELCMDLGPPVA